MFPNNDGMGFVSIFPVFFFLIFALIFGMIVFTIIKSVSQWSFNNQQPLLAVSAKLISKRTDISHHMHDNASDMGHHSNSSSRYYLTFEVETGSRMEFEVNGNEFGLLVEGDFGKLNFQGTRYKGFERVII